MRLDFFNIKIIPTDFLCAYPREHGDKPYQRSQGWVLSPWVQCTAASKRCSGTALPEQCFRSRSSAYIRMLSLELCCFIPSEGWGHGSKILGSCWWPRFLFFCEVFGLQMKNTTGKCFLNSRIKPASISRLKWFPSACSPCSWLSFEIVGDRGRLPCKN